MHTPVSEWKLMRLAVFAGMLIWTGSSLVPGRAGEFKLGDRTLRVPEGFTIERVAGRRWSTGRSPPPSTSRAGSTSPIRPAPTTTSRSSSRRSRTGSSGSKTRDGDGKFDKRTVFADKMMFPEGTMWHDGSLYVAAPPSIWKLTDTDGDGVADQRVEWFQGKTLTGCANDLHGPYLGPRRLDLLVQGGVRRADLRAAGQAAVRHPGGAHLPLPARWHRHRAGHDRRHGQPGRRRLHARRRADLHHHVLRSIPAAASATA